MYIVLYIGNRYLMTFFAAADLVTGSGRILINMAASEIPVVDFSACKNYSEDCDEVNPEINKLAQEIYDAFTTVGFVYIKNHGIPESEVIMCWQCNYFFDTFYSHCN